MKPILKTTIALILILSFHTGFTQTLTWTGNANANWNIPGNWSGGVVPNSTYNVIIPANPTRQPFISSANASCKSLTINSGATLTISGYTLSVSNDINISGKLAMNNQSGIINAYGDVNWESGSTAGFTANTLFYVYGGWKFQTGSNVNLTNGTVIFTGPNTNNILCNSTSSAFNNIAINKSSNAILGINTYSNFPLQINGYIDVHNGSTLHVYSSKDLIIKGNIISNGVFQCYDGTVKLAGTSQSLRMNTGDYFNNLTFNQSGTVTINNTNTNIVEVKKDVVINSGVFNMQDRIMRVGGNWTNTKGSSAFNAGTGRVIFNGSGHQYVKSSEKFNILEIDKGAALRVDSASYIVICNKYEWKKGGIDVYKGTFTALDLVNNGIYGSYYVNPGGTINLHQDASGWIDLNGKFNFNGGGTINVYGGSGYSYWARGGNAEIYMNGGVLDFKNQGIYIYNPSSYTFTHNITGGTIRTSKGLSCYRTDFTPAKGTFEFYGSSDISLYMAQGSHLYEVKINKSSKEGNNEAPDTDGLLSNTLNLASDIKIIKNLEISSGTLHASDKTITIGGDWENNAGLSGFNAGTGRVIFNGTKHQYVKSSENFNILEANMEATLCVDNVAHTLTCNKYDWKKGGIDVIKGTFTALDLVQNGIFGSYYVNPDATINLHQDASGWIDLNGKFNFNGGGTINVYGGSGYSYWARGGNAEIYMNSGVLDFKNQGIYIYNPSSYTFTHNITGGTIRTSKGLSCYRIDFTPAGGTFEFYSSTDASINMVSGSHLYDVKINKSSKEGDESFTGEPVYDQRSGEMISEGGKANTLTLASNFIATGNLTIETGSFNLSSYTCNVAGTTRVFGKLIMNNAANDLTTYNMYWDDGSSANVTAGTFHVRHWDFKEGTTAKLGTGNTAYVYGLYFPESNDAEFGNLVRVPWSKNITDDDNTKTYYPVRVMGYMLIKSGADLDYYTSGSPLIVVGNLTIENGASIKFSGDDLEVGGSLDLAGKLRVYYDRTATIQGAFTFPSTGWLILDKGTFTNNYNSATYTNLYGKLTMDNNSLLEFPGTNIMIGNTFVNEVNAGTLRFGRNLNAPNANNFQLDHGTVEFISAYPNHSVSVYNGNYLNDVVINKTGVSFLVDKNLVIKNDLEINSGSLNTLSNQVTVSGNVTINNGGHLSMGAGGVLAMAASKSVTVKNGGLIEFNGESGTQSKITRNSSGYYALNIESGGKIGAEHTIFEYMNTNGVNIKPGAIIDPANAFTSCIFRLGQSGGRLLTLDNNQTLVIYNAVFPGSPSTYNVSKNVDTGMIIFVDHSGNFSGAAREQDHFSRVHWTGDLAPSVNLNGVNIEEGQNVCFEALQTITTGGSNIFVVENSASANLVAGQKILMLPGTHAKDGSYLHAWISSVGFCSGLPLSIIASKTEEEVLPTHIKAETLNDERFFKVYPNPTKGIFTLELNSVNESGSVKIEIFNLLGERILNTEQQTNSHYQFDLSGNKAGIYFIRVICGENNKIEKLIKQ